MIKTTQYNYRYGDKLTQVAQNWTGGTTVNYEYRGDNKRLSRQEDTDPKTYYHWDAGWNVINETDITGALAATYIHGPAGILADALGADAAAGTWRHYEQDRLGSTRRMRDHDATALNYINYSPYGKILTPNLTDVKYTFTGKEFDSTTNSYYFPYRYYTPWMGSRWITSDPLGMVDGPNLYGYVNDGPTTYNDPMGTSKKKCCVKVIFELDTFRVYWKWSPFQPWPVFIPCNRSQWGECTGKCIEKCMRMGMTTKSIDCGNDLVMSGWWWADYSSLCKCVCCPYNTNK